MNEVKIKAAIIKAASRRAANIKAAKFTFIFSITFASIFSQIPVLNSCPSNTTAVVYLDFDGQVVTGTYWNSGNTINVVPSSCAGNPAAVREIWNRMSEDYRPFNVNITTDSVRFNNADPVQRMRVLFTPTSAWYPNAGGGVAYVGSYSWGGTPGTPCWVFETNLGNNPKNMAEAGSHEIGHTLTLRHQSVYDGSCAKTAEYNAGVGTGIVSWAPIMGAGYSRNVTVWYNGISTLSCNINQYDHGNTAPGITSQAYLTFLTDDVGDTYGNAKLLSLDNLNLLDSGLIATPGDVDVYRFDICNPRYVTLDIKPWALDTINYDGANLDVKLKLYNAANNLLVGDSTLTKLTGRVGANLNAGSYYFVIDGDASLLYSDYGSLGKYYIRIKATNPPTLTNTIVSPVKTCVGQSVSLTCNSNGTPTNWLWNTSGASSNSFTTQAVSLAFNVVGIQTISLEASNSNSASCVVTKTIQVFALPNISVISTNSFLCVGDTATITSSGADSYAVNPGMLSGSSVTISPALPTTYTVIGTNTLTSCFSKSTLFVNVEECSVGLRKFEQQEGIVIFPNPFSSNFTVEASGSDVSLSVYDALGNLIYSKTGIDQKITINAKEWAKGVYFLNLKINKQRIITKKMILE